MKNRAKFLVDIIRVTRERAPADFLISYRISMFSQYGEVEAIEGVIDTVRLLEEAGFDVLGPSGDCQKISKIVEGRKYDHITSTCPPHWPEGHEVKYAINLKKSLKIPIIVVGKIFSPQLAENILELKQADLVALGRSLISDPEWPLKVFEGREKDIRRCREDLRCLRRGGPIQCLANKSLPPEGVDILA